MKKRKSYFFGIWMLTALLLLAMNSCGPAKAESAAAGLEKSSLHLSESAQQNAGDLPSGEAKTAPENVPEPVSETAVFNSAADAEQGEGSQEAYRYEEYPLERNHQSLHLDCVTAEGNETERNILLVHGVTYSSHEFDIDYQDYSLVRALTREGYAVWRLDIAGFGQSEPVEDGFLPDSDYAAEDIHAAVEKIVQVTGQDKIDVLGWSWGTVTTGRFAGKYPEHVNRLVLYAPILSGVGEAEVSEAFHHNTWEHAADDFQRKADGSFDYDCADPVLIEVFCSNCWHFDGEFSPNGGRRDILVPTSESLIDLTKLKMPTLIICGDRDPYLNYDRIRDVLTQLPEGSELEMIPGGSHVVYIEKPYYHDFRERLLRFLSK